MISVQEIRKQAERAYPRFLASLVTGEAFFPLDVRFGKRFMKGTYSGFSEKRELLLDGAARVVDVARPGDSAAGRLVDAARSGMSAASNGDVPRGKRAAGYVVELDDHNSRRFGAQPVPSRIFFDDPIAYASFIGRQGEVNAFRGVVETTRRRLPDLVSWLGRYPMRALPFVGEWADLLDVVQYFLAHPRPNLYPRQLPLSVHTKFVEEHEGILRLILDELLPAEAVNRTSNDFAPRFGLRYDEPLVRVRRLDPSVEPGWPADDVSLPVSALGALKPGAEFVVISENKMTFLTLPYVERGLGLWGGGFRIDLLRTAEWLQQSSVYYWGDLDTHGFMILSRLRSFLPGVRSLMMDVPTFEAFREYAVKGPPSEVETLPYLAPAEQALFQSLARTRLRLEQERIAHAYVLDRLSGVR